MAKERAGFIVKRNGRIYVRVSYTDASGKRRELMRRAENRPEAKKLLKKLLSELDAPNREQRIEGDKMTFNQLAEIFKARRIIAPQYQGDRKIAGMRSYKRQLGFLKPLVAQFGKRLLRDITPADLEAYKLARLKTPTRRGDGVRSIAHVNRELSLMRSTLNYARRQGWLSVNPFEQSESLISPADEVKRDRVLSLEEEARLLAVCVDKREHLRALLIAAVDTGMRRGEMLQLNWRDVDLQSRIIRLRSLTTKTAKARELPITDRLAIELERLKTSVSDCALVFTCGDVKRSFATACGLAGIDNLRWHDLRHTFATRLVQRNLPLSEVARLLGHSSLQMTYRYSNATAETVNRAAVILNDLNGAALSKASREDSSVDAAGRAECGGIAEPDNNGRHSGKQ